jgi:hypothetical protein
MRAVVFGLSVLVAATGVPMRGGAQMPAHGAKVRVATESSHIVGVLSASTSDSIRIAMTQRNRDTVSVAIASIRELAVSDGTRRHTRQGLAYGALGGAVIGATVRYVGFAPCDEPGLLGCYLEPRTRGQATAVGAGIGAVLGMALGSIVGALVVTDRWTIVPTVSVH